MKNLEKFGDKLTREEMKQIVGGTQEQVGFCIICDDGEISNQPCYDDMDCSRVADAEQQYGFFDGYTCSDGTSGGDMSGCPI